MSKPPATIGLTPGKRVLFLTKDPAKVRAQLERRADFRALDFALDDLQDDVNTDAMTPGWVCFDHLPEEIAKNAYAGLVVKKDRLFKERELMDGGFEVIVSGRRKGVGSSRETAVQAEKWSGIRIAIAESFAPIHARNNINQGVLMGDHAMLARLQKGEKIPLAEFTKKWDPITRLVIEHGGLFPFYKALGRGEVKLPARAAAARPMTMAEKILAAHLLPGQGAPYVKPGDSVMVVVDGGYSHEYTTAQVHTFLEDEYGKDYAIKKPERFAVFEDHLIYAEWLKSMAPFQGKIDTLRRLQREFQKHTGVRDFSAKDGRSPGICHEVARAKMVAPGDFIQATDSHTCMGGGNAALAWGVGATEYAALIAAGFTFVTVPESIRFELVGRLAKDVTAKDVMLHILLHYAKNQATLDRVMEFGGPGLESLSVDERATLANMATECSAKSGICEGNEDLVRWIIARRPELSAEALRKKLLTADPGATYAGGVHTIDLSKIRPMVATPGDPDRGIPSDPTNGALIADLGTVKIDIAYGGSCTAGKEGDQDMYAKVLAEAARANRTVAAGTTFFIQFGAIEVEEYARSKGYLDLYAKTGVKVISSGCGACIGCGPGVSESSEQVTVSAINRNYRGRSGPGKLYLASPLTVAASAIAGKIVPYSEGMFVGK